MMGVGGLSQVGAKVLRGRESPGAPNQDLGEVGVDAPVAGFMGVGWSLGQDLLEEERRREAS